MYKPFSSFIYRTPAYPFTRLVAFLEHPDTILSLLSDESVKETIYLASPVLCSEIQKIVDGEIRNEVEKDKIILSFVKYFTRMGTRCTPFGLFAACSSGELGKTTHSQIEDSIRRCTRLDMFYLCTLVQFLLNLPDIKEQLRYFPNNTIYELKKQLRYIEYKYLNNRRLHKISMIEKSKVLSVILKMAVSGITPLEIRNYLLSEDFEEEDVTAFTEDLIRSHLLVSELDVNLTGDSYFEKILSVLHRMDLAADSKKLFDSLCDIRNLLEQSDHTKNGTPMKFYKQIVQLIRIHPVSFQENTLFQVDATRKGTVTIGENVIKELQSVLSYFCKTSPTGMNPNLSNFQRAFSARYEDLEIPLSIALDADLGIGYPVGNGIADIAPILDKLELPRGRNTHSQVVNNVQTFLLQKMMEMEKKGENEIVLYPEEFDGLPDDSARLPSTLFFFFHLIRDSGDDLLLDIRGISDSAAKLMSRFSHLDPKIHELVMEITKKESEIEKEGIIGEIVHLPSSRVGNILFRPHIRENEIVYLAHSDLPETNKISISDLMLSSRNGKLYIRSRKLNKYIFPRLTTAHGYGNDTLPVYRFLCDMQYQNTRSGFQFSWGGLEHSLKYRPRVRYGSSILSLASWTVEIAEIKDLFSLEDLELVKQISNWRTNRNLPKLTFLADGDNELLVDFTSCLSIKALFSVIKKRTSFNLIEFLYDPDTLIMQGESGKYLNECIVPFYRDLK